MIDGSVVFVERLKREYGHIEDAEHAKAAIAELEEQRKEIDPDGSMYVHEIDTRIEDIESVLHHIEEGEW